MSSKLIKLITILSIPLLIGAGCSFSPLGKSSGNKARGTAIDGGVWFSPDKGETWQQRNFIRQEEKRTITMNGLDVVGLKNHPKDSRIIYASTNQGLYFTENAGEQWSRVFAQGQLADFSLDPDVRGILYVAAGRTIFKSTDNGRTWNQRYLEPRTKTTITTIAVDPRDNVRIYAGSSSGDIIMSDDFGKSFQVIQNFGKDRVVKILVNPKDNAFVYVATSKGGIHASFDRGRTWQNLSEFYKDNFKSSLTFHQLTFDASGQSSLVYASDYGLLRSDDGGFTWSEIPTVTPPRAVKYRALFVSPQNPREIYYATLDAFARTFDGGENWVIVKLPTERSAGAVLVDFFETTKVYLGARRIK